MARRFALADLLVSAFSFSVLAAQALTWQNIDGCKVNANGDTVWTRRLGGYLKKNVGDVIQNSAYSHPWARADRL